MTVAHQGKGWRLAPSLIALETDADLLAPRRSRASDGSIGDAAHAARKSDHNVSGGWVHALDLTHDPAGGFDAHTWARRIAERRDPRVKYLISQRRIWMPGTGWSAYGGENPHDKHAHISVLHTDAARNDLSPWLVGANVGKPPAAKPAPTTVPLEAADMFLIVEGLGIYACAPGIRPIFISAEALALAQQRSPGIPTLTLDKSCMGQAQRAGL